MENLSKPLLNIAFTILTSIICFTLWIKSGVMEDAGMAALILNWICLIVGVFTIAGYFLFRLFSKKWCFIATILGFIFNVMMVISGFVG